MDRSKIYIIGNSHMDPIWVWRLREGRAAWLNTCRSVVKMMKKYPFLKFSRSSSHCYQWVENADPKLFREIRKLVDAGRWEIVGGWVEQSDTIITPGESLIRQAEHGKKYFRDRFGKDVKIAYSVDSFGQNIGLPKILRSCGFDYYTWMRPQANEKAMPDIFRWQTDDGAGEILSFRIPNAYCTLPMWKRPEEFEEWFLRSINFQKEKHQSFFFGIGDHGGGIYENQLHWLLQLQDKYDMVFSTLEEYFCALEKEELPVFSGECTHHAPGCYSNVSMIKEQMAECERNLFNAEKIVMQCNFSDRKKSVIKLEQAWETFLFNYFHDVYPGTSTRESYLHEIGYRNGATNLVAVDLIEESLSRVASTIKTDFLTEGGVLLWNPLPQSVCGVATFDGFNDPNASGSIFNCLISENGKEIPLQWIRPATSFGPNNAWGRAVVVADLEPSEFKAFAYGRTTVNCKDVGFKAQKKLLKKLSMQVIDDRYDTWGHGAKELGDTIGRVEVIKVEEMENGPVVSRLRIHYRWKSSEFKLDLFSYAKFPEIEAVWRGEWLEKEETLKVSLEVDSDSGHVLSGQASAVIEREADLCEHPFIHWAGIAGKKGIAGFIADALHSYDSVGSKQLRLTVIRPVVFAEHHPFPPHGDEGYADIGYQQHSFWVFEKMPTVQAVSALAQRRIYHAEHLEITAAGNGKHFSAAQWEIVPNFIEVSAQRYNSKHEIQFSLFNPVNKDVICEIKHNGKSLKKACMSPYALLQLKI